MAMPHPGNGQGDAMAGHGPPAVHPGGHRPARLRRRVRPAATSSSRPNSASPRDSSAGHRLSSGGSRRTTRPSSESPWRGGRNRSSTSAAMTSVIAHSQSPGHSAHRGSRGRSLDCGEVPELRYETVIVRGKLAVDPGGKVSGQARAQAARASFAATGCFPGTTGRRSSQRAARPPRRSRGYWPRSPCSRTPPGTPGASGTAAAPGHCARTGPRPAARRRAAA